MINGGDESGEVSLAPIARLFALGGYRAGQVRGKGGQAGLEAEHGSPRGGSRPCSACPRLRGLSWLQLPIEQEADEGQVRRVREHRETQSLH